MTLYFSGDEPPKPGEEDADDDADENALVDLRKAVLNVTPGLQGHRVEGLGGGMKN